MGEEGDPKDGKVVAGSIFWAVLVYAVRLSPFLLVAAHPLTRHSFFPLPFPHTHNMPGMVVWRKEEKRKWKKKGNKKKQDLILREWEFRFSSCFVVFKQFYITEQVNGGLYR